MGIDKIDEWNDARVQKRSAHLNGRTYGYLYSEPEEGYRGTIFLIHGFPDLSMGWRYQIPMLLSLGLRVVAPDCMGYGRTDAPPYTLLDYGFKRISDDMAELARQLGVDRIILGGHDWGGAVVYRMALYHPTLVTALFSICTPYWPPSLTYQPLLPLTRTTLPNFTYQLHFASGALESAFQSRPELKAMLNAVFGGASHDGQPAFDVEQGFRLEGLQSFARTSLLSDDELEYYAQEFSRSGIHGPLNWYRTREVNWADEYEHFFRFGEVTTPPQVEQEVLFVLARRDRALRPEIAGRMVEGGEGVVRRLRRREVEAGHWALWERPEEVNALVKEWLEDLGLIGGSGRAGKGGTDADERMSKL